MSWKWGDVRHVYKTDIEKIRKLFYYKEGKLIRFKDNKEVGWLSNNGYLCVDIDYEKFLVHRLIWALHYDEVPDMLDHKDRNKLNNNINNLRPADKSLNSLNRELRSDNKSGKAGVTYCKRTGRYEVRHKGKFYGRYSYIN